MTAPFAAGAGRAAVHFPHEVWPLDGFTGEHDPLQVRVLVLDAERRIVLAVLDQTSLAEGPLERVREVLAAATGAAACDILISVSHTFSAPHLSIPDDRSDTRDAERQLAALGAVLDAVREAGDEAVAGLRPSAVGSAFARCGIAVNRDVEVADGWTLGVDENGFTDPTLLITGIFDRRGTPLALLVDVGVQPSVMHGSVSSTGERWVTADLAGAAMSAVEAHFDGAVAFFLIGAAGDQSPVVTAVRRLAGGVQADAGDDAFVVVTLLGERLGAAALRAVEAITDNDETPVIDLSEHRVALASQRARARDDIRPTRTPSYETRTGVESRSSVTEDAPFWILRIGQTTLVGVQVELSAVTGVGIRESSPFVHAAVMTMVNGGAKYLPEASAFHRGTYEAQSSRYAQGGAEKLADAIQARLVAVQSRNGL